MVDPFPTEAPRPPYGGRLRSVCAGHFSHVFFTVNTILIIFFDKGHKKKRQDRLLIPLSLKRQPLLVLTEV